MLILTRRVGEAILIDGGIRIVVLGTEGGGIRLGIDAPASVGIVREEILQRSSGAEAGDDSRGARSGGSEKPEGVPGEEPGNGADG